jgi:hypothetical protein
MWDRLSGLKTEITAVNIRRAYPATPFTVKVGTYFADKLRPLGRQVRVRTKATEFSF